MNVCILPMITPKLHRIVNNQIVSFRIDTYRIVLWPYRLIPIKYQWNNSKVVHIRVCGYYMGSGSAKWPKQPQIVIFVMLKNEQSYWNKIT